MDYNGRFDRNEVELEFIEKELRFETVKEVYDELFLGKGVRKGVFRVFASSCKEKAKHTEELKEGKMRRFPFDF